MDMNTLAQSAAATLVAVAWKLAGAVVLWLVGRWLINLATGSLDAPWRDSSSTPRSPGTS